jgi:PAS domain S-box-containing protein
MTSTLQLVLDTALDAVIVIDTDGRVMEWSHQTEVIFGWQRQEAVGSEMASLIIPEQYREAHRQGIRHFLATGEGPVLRKRIEITGLRKNGEEFPIELSICPAAHEGRKVFLGFIRDITSRVRAEERQNLLLAELEHRTKNMLSVVMAITQQTARSAISVDAFTKDYLGRLTALSRAYALLTAKSWQAVSLHALISEVISPHLSSPEQFEFTGCDITFPAKSAVSISMILHELTTNAAKYGALRFNGKISLTAELSDGPGPSVRLVWQESGVTHATAPTRSGFGSRLIDTTIRHELKGTANVSFESEGVRYEFCFPLPTVAGAM